MSTHQDTPSASLTGPMFTTGLFMDPSNNAFYGRLLTAASGGTPPDLVLGQVARDGTEIFSQTWTGSASSAGVSPLVIFFTAGGDGSGGLHAPFSMGGDPASIGDGVYCFAGGGSFEGISGSSAVSLLEPGDFIHVTPGNNLAMLKALGASADLGCGNLTVPAGGAWALAAFNTGGGCTWSQVLSLPTATALDETFELGAAGQMLLAVVYSGTINLGGGSVTSTGTSSLAVAVYGGADDSASSLVWTTSFGGDGSSFTLGSISANAAGDVVLTGRYQGQVDLGGGTLPSGDDTFLAVFSPTGTLEWSQTVTVGSGYSLEAAAGTCGLVLATNSPTVNLGTGPLSTASDGVQSIGVAALGL